MSEGKILLGDCLETLKTLDAGSVQTCVTSPPYYGLRDYGVEGQIGLEETPEAFVDKMVQVFREVRRVLKPSGTLWLNLGDSYAGGGNYRGVNSEETLSEKQRSNRGARGVSQLLGAKNTPNCKPKDLIGVPWMVAFALRTDGWYLRSDIIWHKPNPMPESVTDRPTKSHEYIFLLSKSVQYYYDAEAIAEPLAPASIARLSEPNLENQEGSYTPSKGNGKMKAWGGRASWRGDRTVPTEGRKQDELGKRTYTGFNERYSERHPDGIEFRNRRDVWTVTTKPYKEAHFATFPPDLIEPCILAGSREGDTVLDPFGGSGTTAAVAVKHKRNYVICELNPDYIELATKRLAKVQPVLFAP